MKLSVKPFIFSLLGLLLQTAVGEQNVTRINLQIVKAKAGKSVTINCPIESDTSAFSLTWTFGYERENIADHQSYKSRTKFGKFSKEMKISNLTEEDSGIYFCQWRNVYKVVESGAILEVIPSPDPAVMCTDKVFLPVQIIRITCLIILITLLGIAVKNSY